MILVTALLRISFLKICLEINSFLLYVRFFPKIKQKFLGLYCNDLLFSCFTFCWNWYLSLFFLFLSVKNDFNIKPEIFLLICWLKRVVCQLRELPLVQRVVFFLKMLIKLSSSLGLTLTQGLISCGVLFLERFLIRPMWKNI